MNTKKKAQEFNSIEEEREYWEVRGLLGKGHRGKLNTPDSSVQRSSFLSVRLSGNELTAWRDFATRCGEGPSTAARRLILTVLEQAGRPVQESNKSNEGKHTMTLDEVGAALTKMMPDELKNRMQTLIESSGVPDTSNPSFWIMDPSQTQEFLTLSAKIMVLLVESLNPNIKVVTPADSNYDKVKSVLAMP
jgi:hypothetical protein